MTKMREWIARLLGTFRERPRDAEMQAELELHVELTARELERRGLSKDEAARAARQQAGAVTPTMDVMRDRRGLPWLSDLIQDARYGARTLRRTPMFTALALLTLTLAIGANTAIFSLVDPLLFRDLPVRDPAGLVQFTWRYPGDPPLNMFSVQRVEQYRDHNSVFSDMAGLAPLETATRADGDPTGAEAVTGNFFAALGVSPALGRVLEPADDTPGSGPVAVVSWRYWKTHFNGEARVLGATLDIEDRRISIPVHATIVGVAERRFTGVLAGRQPDVWMSLAWLPDAMRSRAGLALIARLKPGIAIEQARAEMRVLDRDRIEGFARADPQWRQVVLDVTSARTGLATPLHDQFGGPLRVLMTIVGVLLLLACANLGGMLLARGAARQHEMAVRVSLGAGRFRIVRQVLTESLLLAAVGSVAGIAAARAGASLLLRIVTSGTRVPGGAPLVEIPLDARVLLFAIGVTVLAALLFGLAPAIAACASTPAGALRARAGGTQTRSRRLVGCGLVVAQVALSLAILSVSQLYAAHLSRLRDRSLGFDREGVLLVSVDASRPGRSREQIGALYRDALIRVQAIPGVRSVAASGMTPISGAAGSRFVRVDGYEEPLQSRRRLSMNVVTPNYFSTYGTALLAGRDFRDADADQPRRVVVNQAMATQYFAGRDPIGHRVWFDDEREGYEIVGVAGDAKYQDVRIAAPPTVYLFSTLSSGSADLSLRTTVRPAALSADVRRALADVFGGDAVKRVTTLADQVDASIVPERLMAILSGFFGAVGALLAAAGLYGVLAYTVARRTKEIGVRMALGATRADVIRMVLNDALLLVLTGVLFGLPAAFWSERVAATMVEHLAAGGIVPIAAGASALLAVGLLAAYGPVRRATRIDPIAALRAE